MGLYSFKVKKEKDIFGNEFYNFIIHQFTLGGGKDHKYPLSVEEFEDLKKLINEEEIQFLEDITKALKKMAEDVESCEIYCPVQPKSLYERCFEKLEELKA